jgi:hypothetical protein
MRKEAKGGRLTYLSWEEAWEGRLSPWTEGEAAVDLEGGVPLGTRASTAASRSSVAARSSAGHGEEGDLGPHRS